MPQGPTGDLGPCIVIYDGVDLGRTFGGCTFRYSETDAPVHEDQQGTDPVDDINVGSPVSVDVPLSRMTTATLAALLAGASGSGTSGTTMTVRGATGTSRYDRAKELILKPVLLSGVADPDTDKWLHVFKASPMGNYEFQYDNSTQRAYMHTFVGYPDQVGPPLYRKWRIGPAVS